jgi:hypothetical protein
MKSPPHHVKCLNSAGSALSSVICFSIPTEQVGDLISNPLSKWDVETNQHDGNFYCAVSILSDSFIKRALN